METFLNKHKHHANLIVQDDRESYTKSLWDEVRANSIGNTFFEYSVLDIDSARSIITWVNSPLGLDRIALLSFHTITVPAQNALLKLLEEPRDGVRFFLVTSNKQSLLPTLLSRLNHIETKNNTSNDTSPILFLKTNPLLRMKIPFVAQLISAVDKEGRKDRERVRSFLLQLAKVDDRALLPSEYITEVIEIASYAGDPSSSPKALIEYLALKLPWGK